MIRFIDFIPIIEGFNSTLYCNHLAINNKAESNFTRAIQIISLTTITILPQQPQVTSVVIVLYSSVKTEAHIGPNKKKSIRLFFHTTVTLHFSPKKCTAFQERCDYAIYRREGSRNDCHSHLQRRVWARPPTALCSTIDSKVYDKSKAAKIILK